MTTGWEFGSSTESQRAYKSERQHIIRERGDEITTGSLVAGHQALPMCASHSACAVRALCACLRCKSSACMSSLAKDHSIAIFYEILKVF